MNTQKGNTTIISVIIIVLVIVGVALLMTSDKSSQNEVTEAPTQNEVTNQNNQDQTDQVAEAPAGDNIASAGSYEIYSPEKIAMANEKNVVMFFHATWCPSCQVLEKDINASLNDIPEDVVILKTDYDANQNLRQKYGINMQHSFVQVDAEGNAIKAWAGGNTLEDILGKVRN